MLHDLLDLQAKELLPEIREILLQDLLTLVPVVTLPMCHV